MPNNNTKETQEYLINLNNESIKKWIKTIRLSDNYRARLEKRAMLDELEGFRLKYHNGSEASMHALIEEQLDVLRRCEEYYHTYYKDDLELVV